MPVRADPLDSEPRTANAELRTRTPNTNPEPGTRNSEPGVPPARRVCADLPRMADLHPRSEPTLERTAAPLAIALLGYFLLVTLVITLSPFDFAPRRLRISYMVVPRDIIANITLFLPIGFLVRSL